MKQKLRLGDSYASLGGYPIRNRYMRKPRVSRIASTITSVLTRVKPSINVVYKSWINTASILEKHWGKYGRNKHIAYRGRAERPCVCTHAKVPAQNGLGLALGLVVLVSLSTVASLSAQTHKDSALVYENSPVSFIDRLVDQTAQQLDQDLRGLVIGDTLPESFWNLHLKVVNHPQELTSIHMGNFRDKLLVLDFWANYCKPCIESMDQWNSWQQKFAVELAVIPVHVYYPSSEALPFAEERGWGLPISVGNRADTLLNKLFYAYRSFGQVWIKDGRLFAIPEHSSVTEQNLVRVLTNKPVSIKMNDYLTYFDKRYLLVEGDGAGGATSQEIND